MVRHFVLFMTLVVISVSVNSQNLNKYKYVVVPDSYDFLKGEKDRYQLNSLTHFLFEKYGFNAILESEPYPDDLQTGSCKALFADVESVSNLFTIKLQVLLKDCKNTVVFTSLTGKSKNKEYQKGYQEALREAFKSVKAVNFSYEESLEALDTSLAKQDQKTAISNTVPKTPAIAAELPKKANENTSLNMPSPSQIAAPANSKDKEVPVPETTINKVVYIFKGDVYAFNKVATGFKMIKVDIDKSSTEVGTLFTTSRPNNYIVKAADLSGNGFFDSYGNFVLERINPATGKIVTDTFAREDQ